METSYRYSGVHVVTSLTQANVLGVLEYSRVLCDVTLLFWLWHHCKVYWNVNVLNLRAQQKMMQSQISYEIFIVNRYYPHIHRVHKKFHLNCISLKLRGDSLESGQILIFAVQWLMGLSLPKYVKDVRLILKRKIYTGMRQSMCIIVVSRPTLGLGRTN